MSCDRLCVACHHCLKCAFAGSPSYLMEGYPEEQVRTAEAGRAGP